MPEEEKQEEPAAAPQEEPTSANDVEQPAAAAEEPVEEAKPEDVVDVDDADADQDPVKDEDTKQKAVSVDAPWSERMWEVFTTFWPLGFVRNIRRIKQHDNNKRIIRGFNFITVETDPFYFV